MDDNGYVGFRDFSSVSTCAHNGAQITSRDRSEVPGFRSGGRAGCCRLAGFVVLIVFISPGCRDSRFLAENCPPPADPLTAAESPAPNAAYLVGCPDVLEISFVDHPQWDVLVTVDLDGRLPLEYPGPVHAEGRTLEDIHGELARLAGSAPERIMLRLAAARSSRIYVHGPIRGRIRIVPYQGPEPVIDMLIRIGGLPPGSRLNQVYVVRPNVAAGERPEVFRVNVPRVLMHHDQYTNVVLKPSDQVYIGETSGSAFARALPDWLAPMYRRFVGLMPDDWFPKSRIRVSEP